MRKVLFTLLLSLPCAAFAQMGIKAGYNFAKVTKASNINSQSKSGFHIGGFYGSVSKRIVGSRSEFIFSRQGYNYQNGTSGDVSLDYVQMGQMMTISPIKQFTLMFGAQTAYLLNASVDSTSNTGSASGSEKNLLDFYNRVDYGYAVGFEIHPVGGLLIGARYNVSLAKVYKNMQNMQPPSFTASDAKNNVVQLSIGWRFGYGKDKKDVSALQ